MFWKRKKEKAAEPISRIHDLEKKIAELQAKNFEQSVKISELIFSQSCPPQFNVLERVRDYVITNVEAVSPTLSKITAAAQLTVNLLYVMYYAIEKKPLPKSIEKQCEEFLTGWHYEYTVIHILTFEKSVKKESELIALK